MMERIHSMTNARFHLLKGLLMPCEVVSNDGGVTSSRMAAGKEGLLPRALWRSSK